MFLRDHANFSTYFCSLWCAMSHPVAPWQDDFHRLLGRCSAIQGVRRDSPGGCFHPVLQATDRAGGKRKLPYFGVHLLWRCPVVALPSRCAHSEMMWQTAQWISWILHLAGSKRRRTDTLDRRSGRDFDPLDDTHLPICPKNNCTPHGLSQSGAYMLPGPIHHCAVRMHGPKKRQRKRICNLYAFALPK